MNSKERSQIGVRWGRGCGGDGTCLYLCSVSLHNPMFIRKNFTKNKVYLPLKLQRKPSEETFCCYKTTAGRLPKQCKAEYFLRGHADSQKASVMPSPTGARARAACGSDGMPLRGTGHPADRQPGLHSGLLWPPLNKY